MNQFDVRKQAKTSAEKHGYYMHNKEYEDGYCIGFRAGHNECKKNAKNIIKDLLNLLNNEAYSTRCYEEIQRAEEFIKE